MTVKLDPLILGANPFEGVSYIGRSQSLHYLEYFAKEDNVAAVLDAAYSAGVRALTCSNTANVIGALQKFPKSQDLSVYPVIPNAYEYAMEASEKGVLGAIMSKAKGFSMYQKVKLGLRALTKIKSVLTKDVMDMLLELLNFEMISFEKMKLGGVILHGQITDLALSSRNPDILSFFQDVIRENYGVEPILATHNFGVLLPQLIEWKIKIPIMAPLNSKGFMMKPSKEECEALVRDSGYQIIAKKVLAGGRLSPEEAFPYLLDKKIESVVVGIGSVPEAYHTFTVAKNILKI
ncbi:MAG: hypothetical protein ABSF88_08255 [Candidatus Aminicenantales bacterium]